MINMKLKNKNTKNHSGKDEILRTIIVLTLKRL